MLSKIVLLFGVVICMTNAAPQSASPNNGKSGSEAEIKLFHVKSKIQLRYAITDVETHLQNKHTETKEVLFDMFIPKEAFVSNFTMEIKGKTYQAAIKTKEIAQQIYENSTDTSGILQSMSQPEFTDGKQVNTLLLFSVY